MEEMLGSLVTSNLEHLPAFLAQLERTGQWREGACSESTPAPNHFGYCFLDTANVQG